MSTPTTPRGTQEAGFTLAEVIVSMVLLGLLAMAFLPLALRTTTAVAGGTALTTATRVAGEQMEVIRADPVASCRTDDQWRVVGTMTDPRGVQLQTRTRTTGTCPGLVRYDVSVSRVTAPAMELAGASTLVLVSTP